MHVDKKLNAIQRSTSSRTHAHGYDEIAKATTIPISAMRLLMQDTIYEMSGGEINVWVDDGVIYMKIINEYNDPAELSEHAAEELANLLLGLVHKIRTGEL